MNFFVFNRTLCHLLLIKDVLKYFKITLSTIGSNGAYASGNIAKTFALLKLFALFFVLNRKFYLVLRSILVVFGILSI